MVLLQAQAYLGVFYMRGLQPKEKRGLKYLLLAAKNGVSAAFVSYDCSQFGIIAGYRWQILGLLGDGSECWDFITLSERREWSLGASWRRNRPWDTDPTKHEYRNIPIGLE